MALEKLKQFAEKQGFKIKYIDFGINMESLQGRKIGYLCDKKILLNEKMNENDEAFVLAHELAHAYLHCDKGDTVGSHLHKQYEEQANRAANLILDLIAIGETISFGGTL